MPGSLPPYHLETCLPARREPGMMAFNVRPGGEAEAVGGAGWLLGVDQEGEFALDLDFADPVQDVRLLPNGNLLFSQTTAGLISEITRAGEYVRRWHISGKWTGKSPPKESVPIDLPLSHHTINFFANGNLLVLSAEVRELDNWPDNDREPNAPRGKRKVVGDVILEVAGDGEIVNEWRMLDILDPERLCYGSCSHYWRMRGIADSYDWCHTNAVIHDPSDNSLIASVRHQDCMIKIDCASGALKWILGDPGNWRAPWSDKLLKPVGEVNWQYHQHDCSITPAGTVLCFDNGSHKALPFAPGIAPADNYSRAAEFAVDEDAMTVSEVWSYGEGPGERLFACYQGGTYRLPETGNTFITYGGICTQDGRPAGTPEGSFTRSRLVEVTPEKEIVFDLWIDGSAEDPAMALSSFRAEHLPPA